MKKRFSIGGAWVACMALALGMWTAPALAAPTPASTPASTRQPTTLTLEKEIVVTGKHYKPRVFIFFGKPKLNLDWSLDDPRFKRSFLERTLSSVWSQPF